MSAPNQQDSEADINYPDQDLTSEESSMELEGLVVRLCLNREYGKLQTLLKSGQLSRQQYVQFQPIGWFLDIRWLFDYIYPNREDWDLSFITHLICQDADSLQVAKDRGLTTGNISPCVWVSASRE
jgi:hypothetical protein